MSKYRNIINSLIKEYRGKDRLFNNTNKWLRNSINTDNKAIKRTGGEFQPGKIYIFKYNKPLNPDRPWDENPVVLSLGRENGLDIGLNLNYLNYNQKIYFLDEIYNQYSSIIENNIEKSIDVNRQGPIHQLNYDNIKNFLKKNNIIKCYRRYRQEQRLNSIVVGYTEWARIPFLSVSSFKNITERDI